MMITADGKVGIGVSSSIDSLLHVAGADAQINIEGTSGDATLKLESTGNSYWNIFNDDSDARKLKFEDNGNGVALTIERDGDVGIGTTSPQDTRLDITDYWCSRHINESTIQVMLQLQRDYVFKLFIQTRIKCHSKC